MISDQAFEEWLGSHSRNPVWVLKLVSHDGTQERTLYCSSKDFLHPTNTFYGCLHEPRLRISMSSSALADFSEISIGEVTLDDLNGELDHWRSFRNLSATLTLGDRSWIYEDHRVMLNAIVSDWSSDGDEHQIELRDTQSIADTLIEYADLTSNSGNVGALLQSVLTDAGVSNVNTASITELQTLYPFQCSIDSYDGTKNVLNIIDSLLAGLPVDYGANVLNEIEVQILKKPVLAEAKNLILIARPDVRETINPLGRYVVRNSTIGDVPWSSASVLADYGVNAQEAQVQVSVDNITDANSLISARASLFDTPIDVVDLYIEPQNLKVTDSVSFSYEGLGFNAGVLGTVVEVEIDEVMRIGVAVWR